MGSGSGSVVPSCHDPLEPLRRQIAEIRKGQAGNSRLKYPQQFCKDIASAIDQGNKSHDLAVELGLTPSMVKRWHLTYGKISLARAHRAEFLPLEVKSECATPAFSERLYDVITPHGYIIRGMSISDIGKLPRMMELT